MPYNASQRRLFGMVAGGKIKRKGMTASAAKKLLSEGKKSAAHELMRKK